MGFVKLRDGIVDHFSKMSGSEFKVFIAMCVLANRKTDPVGAVTMSGARVAKSINLPESTVRDAIRGLISKQYLRRIRGGFLVENFDVGQGSTDVRATFPTRSRRSADGQPSKNDEEPSIDRRPAVDRSPQTTEPRRYNGTRIRSEYVDVSEDDSLKIRPPSRSVTLENKAVPRKRGRNRRKPSGVFWSIPNKAFALAEGDEGVDWSQGFMDRWLEFFSRDEIKAEMKEARAWCMRPKNQKRIERMKRWDDFLDRWMQKALSDKNRIGNRPQPKTWGQILSDESRQKMEDAIEADRKREELGELQKELSGTEAYNLMLEDQNKRGRHGK